MKNNSGEKREGQLSTDRDTIREWAREHDATPIRETETEGESGRFRMVPKDDVAETHETVEWEEFFDQLDEGDHVVIYHADGDREPFEVVGQSSIASRVDDEEIEQRLMDGETVTSTITETTVVESVVVEETTVDSELVDTQVVDERVIDAELLRRECTDCELVADETADTREWFDTDRYLENVTGHVAGVPVSSAGTERQAGTRGQEGATEPMSTNATDRPEKAAPEVADTRETVAGPETTGVTESDPESTRVSDSGFGSEPDLGDEEFPFHAELEAEETWAVTRSFTEEFTVESVVTDTEVTEADTIEDYDLEMEGLHRSIVESGIMEEDVPVDEAMSDYEIQSELSEPNRITTTFARERTVEDEIVDTTLATASVTDVQPLEMDVVRTKQLENTAAPPALESDPETEEDLDAGEDTGEDLHADADMGEGLNADEEPFAHSSTYEGATSSVTITDEVIGHSVVNSKGDRIGLVTEVEKEANALFIDPEPGIAERIRSVLGWGDADADDYRLEAEMVSRITDDQVELKSPEELN